MKKRLSSLFTWIFVAAFVAYFLTHLHSFKPLIYVPVLSLLAVALTKMSLNIVNGYFMKWTVEVFIPKKLELKETIYISILSGIGNFFGPLLGGAAIRATYFKKIHKLSYSRFASTLAGYYVIVFAANSAIAILSLAFLGKSVYSSGLLLFFGAWLVAMIGMMFVRLPQRERFVRVERNKIGRLFVETFYEIETSWRFMIKKRGLLPRLTSLAFAGFIITFINGYIEFHAIKAPITVAGLGLYTAISTCSMLVSLTPGAIGIRESLLLLTSSAMGVSTAQILQVSVIDRAISFLVLGLLYAMTQWYKPEVLSKMSQPDADGDQE